MGAKRVVAKILVAPALFVLAGCGASCGGGSTGTLDAGPDGSTARDASVRPEASLPPPDASTPVDALHVDSQVLPDAGPDAGPNPYVIELPPTGLTSVYGFTNSGHIMAYADDRSGVNNIEVFYFNVLDLAEHRVTNRPSTQGMPYVLGEEIVFQDHRFYDNQSGNYQIELYEFNITANIETRLTDGPTVKIHPVFNENYIVYHSSEGCPDPFLPNLSLVNRHTTEVVVLADCDQNAEGHSIAGNLATWAARPYPSHNKDVFVRDLQAGVTFRIDSTDPGNQTYPHAEGDYVVWQDDRDGRREVYLHTFSTGQTECLTPDSWEQAWPHLRNGIVSWCDYRYSQQWGHFGDCDIYVYDLETGVGRRVTAQSRTWRVAFVDSGWILYALWITSNHLKLYAHDLVGDGILSPGGHVIP